MPPNSSEPNRARTWAEDAPTTIDPTGAEQDAWARRIARPYLRPNEQAASFAELIESLDEESSERLRLMGKHERG